MQIYVNSKLAALAKDSSFEFVSENRLFSGSDGYTLTITFPLRDCPENIDIFGHINRADVSARKVIFDCEIRDRNFYKFGSLTITEISEAEVKTQFLEGRSEQNFDMTFDDVFINELDLGNADDCDDSSPSNAWNPHLQNMKCVALPWVNDYSGNIQNLADYNADSDSFSWNSECKGRSWQPYLLYISKMICEAVGYSADFSKWEQKEELKYLLICNTFPNAWYSDNFATALPHWSVAEFFEKLELLLGGEFNINHRTKSISFDFTENVLIATNPVQLDNIVDEHSTDVTVENENCDYMEAKNLVYKECDHIMWKFYSCDWFIKTWQKKVVRYTTLSQLLSDNQYLKSWNGSSQRNSNLGKLLYAEDVDAYFIIRALSKTLVQKFDDRPNIYSYKMELRPVNLFGGRIVDDSDDADEVEIEFVPAWIDETEDKYGKLLFLSFSSYNDSADTSTASFSSFEEYKETIDNTFYQPQSMQTLSAGEKDKTTEFYSVIYVAWWDGSLPGNGKLPHPYAENIEILDDWSSFRSLNFSLRINNKYLNQQRTVHQIDPRIKTTFKFLADKIPNPRAVFFIRGKRYICEKITATFTENGMSQLLKGVFYPIIEG